MQDDLIGKFIKPPANASGKGETIERGGAARAGGDEREYGPRPYMLDLVTVGGTRHAFPYAHLLRICYDPSTGIELFFATHTVTLRGRSLDPLYEELIAHAVPQVVAVGERHDVGAAHGSATQPIVNVIHVQKTSGDGEAT